MENNKKYYTRENGEKIELSLMNTEHIINSIAKKQREIFSKDNKDDVSKELQEIKDLREEYFKRFNEWYDKLGD